MFSIAYDIRLLQASAVLRNISLWFAQLFIINWLRTCTRKKGKADLTWWKNRLQRRAKRDSTAEKLEPPSQLIIDGGGKRKVSPNGKLYFLWIVLSPSCSSAVEKKVNGDADAAEDAEDDGDGHPMISAPSSPQIPQRPGVRKKGCATRRSPGQTATTNRSASAACPPVQRERERLTNLSIPQIQSGHGRRGVVEKHVTNIGLQILCNIWHISITVVIIRKLPSSQRDNQTNSEG